MDNSLLLQRIKKFKAISILLISFFAQSAFALESATNTESNILPIGIFINLPQVLSSACLIGQPCPNDAVWTGWQLPTLQVGQELSFSTSSSSFGLYLGNSLKGQLEVSLTPVFQLPNKNNNIDELTANIADRYSIVSTTNDGITHFVANTGSDYFLLLSGTVRTGITYQLQVSQVPLPASFGMLGSGLTVLLLLRKINCTYTKWLTS